jgi:hypothetical protein
MSAAAGYRRVLREADPKKRFRGGAEFECACDRSDRSTSKLKLKGAVEAGYGGLVLGVVFSTGIGAGIVHRGNIIRGRGGLTGEWAHTPFSGARTIDRGACYCGRFNCSELFLNAAALSARFETEGR